MEAGSRSGSELLLSRFVHAKNTQLVCLKQREPRPSPSSPDALPVDGFYWVVLNLRPSQSRFFPSVCAALAASLDAANAHITHFNSHDSGIHVVSNEITSAAGKTCPLQPECAFRQTRTRGAFGLCVGAFGEDRGSDQAGSGSAGAAELPPGTHSPSAAFPGQGSKKRNRLS